MDGYLIKLLHTVSWLAASAWLYSLCVRKVNVRCNNEIIRVKAYRLTQEMTWLKSDEKAVKARLGFYSHRLVQRVKAHR
jgi:hypothetical protein